MLLFYRLQFSFKINVHLSWYKLLNISPILNKTSSVFLDIFKKCTFPPPFRYTLKICYFFIVCNFYLKKMFTFCELNSESFHPSSIKQAPYSDVFKNLKYAGKPEVAFMQWQENILVLFIRNVNTFEMKQIPPPSIRDQSSREVIIYYAKFHFGNAKKSLWNF